MKLRNFPTPIAPAIALVCRLSLGILFLYAGWEKIIAPREFAIAVYNYRLLPDAAINLVAVVLPWLEVLLAAGLVSGCCLRGSSLLSALLFMTFAAAMTISLVRGLDISCGCFGGSAGSINWLYLVRDLSLLGMSIITLIFDSRWGHFLSSAE